MSSSEDLPTELWEFIFHLLGDQRHLRPISLVSKRFLSLTNLARTTLNFSSYTSFSIFPFYIRFPNLTALNLNHPFFSYDYSLIEALAKSNLPLRSLHFTNQTQFRRELMSLLGRMSVIRRTLRTLSFIHLDPLDDEDLLVIAKCFPYLHHLHFDQVGYGKSMVKITDKGICAILMALRTLLSCTICANNYISRDLFSNSTKLPRFESPSDDHVAGFRSYGSLSSLYLECVRISKSGFDKLSQSNLNLCKLALCSPLLSNDVTARTICRFLKSCRLLSYLTLRDFTFPDPISLSDFVASIPNMEVINISLCFRLDDDILFHLLKNCLNLQEIYIRSYNFKIPNDSFTSLVHHKLRKLTLYDWNWCSGFLRVVGSTCPNLDSICFYRTTSFFPYKIESLQKASTMKLLEELIDENGLYVEGLLFGKI